MSTHLYHDDYTAWLAEQAAALLPRVCPYGLYYVERTKAVIDGTWESHSVWHGLKEGIVEMAPYGPAVSPDVQAKTEEIRTGIIEGTHDPFTGPIKDQSGEVKIAEGETAPDEMLLGMDWYVEGVRA